MKKFFLPLLAIAAAIGITGCQDDLKLTGPGQNGEDDGNYAFIRASIALPTGSSRSATEDTDGDGQTNSDASPDFEIGQTYENDVRSLVLVIASAQDEYIAHLTVNGLTQQSNTSENHVFSQTCKIPYDVLERAYTSGPLSENDDLKDGQHPVHVYAFCNYTQHLLEQLDAFADSVATFSVADRKGEKMKTWLNYYGQVKENSTMAGQTPVSSSSIWSKRSFLMSNSEVFESMFPANIEAWSEYADNNNPLDLSTGKPYVEGESVTKHIKVERVAARIDFKDGSPSTTPANTYYIRTVKSLFNNSGVAAVDDDPEDDGAGQVDVGTDYLELYGIELSRMVLVNMSKDFYYLRRVSNTGYNKDFEICGRETSKNYVVDVYANEKGALGTKNAETGDLIRGIQPAEAEQYFNFPLYDKTGKQYNYISGQGGEANGWYISDIVDVLNGTADNWNSKEYHTWRYVTENTLPAVLDESGNIAKGVKEFDNQQVQQSTGVIFKGAILAGPDIAATVNEGGERYVSEIVQEALSIVNKKVYLETGDGAGKAIEYDSSADKKPLLPKGATYGETEEERALPALYFFQNTLFGGVGDIVKMAFADDNGGSLYFAVDQILNNWYAGADKKFVYCGKGKDAKTKPENAIQLNVTIAHEILNDYNPTDGSKNYGDEGYTIDFSHPEGDDASIAGFQNARFIEECPAQGITVFIPTNDDGEGWGYYCYYFYWIRHNDNNKSGEMGRMEFATVRNNVYKLAVTKIGGIGHPRRYDRDPDPVTPGTPDEDPTRSITVHVEVLPWVVRVNNIEF